MHAYLSSQWLSFFKPIYRRCSMLISPARDARHAPLIELTCSDVLKAALEGIQMMGVHSASEYEMEHHVRNAPVRAIYGGTSEIQREIIGTT